jgi:hypothetical protein
VCVCVCVCARVCVCVCVCVRAHACAHMRRAWCPKALGMLVSDVISSHGATLQGFSDHGRSSSSQMASADPTTPAPPPCAPLRLTSGRRHLPGSCRRLQVSALCNPSCTADNPRWGQRHFFRALITLQPASDAVFQQLPPFTRRGSSGKRPAPDLVLCTPNRDALLGVCACDPLIFLCAFLVLINRASLRRSRCGAPALPARGAVPAVPGGHVP